MGWHPLALGFEAREIWIGGLAAPFRIRRA